VDETGATTLLATAKASEFEVNVPYTRFALFGSTEPTLKSFSTESVYFFSQPRESLATYQFFSGYVKFNGPAEASSSFWAKASGASPYSAPMLGLGSLKSGEEIELELHLLNGSTDRQTEIFVQRRQSGAAVRANFRELQDKAVDKFYAVWTVSTDNAFAFLGRVGGKSGNHAEIVGQTALTDFGLLITLEPEGQVSFVKPTGLVVGVAKRLK